jgi:predicted transcriptional regulator of viral defense system
LTRERAIATLSRLSERTDGVFRGRDAEIQGVSRKQLSAFATAGIVERVLPNTYRMTAVAKTSRQALRAAVLWAGDAAAAAGCSAAELYGLEGIVAQKAEIVVPREQRLRAAGVVVHRCDDPRRLMLRRSRGIPATGIEPTLVALAASLDAEHFEIACEDARRRHLTSLPALSAYLDRLARSGHPGVAALRSLLRGWIRSTPRPRSWK